MRIFLDVDCVIADFVGYWERRVGRELVGFGYEIDRVITPYCWEQTQWNEILPTPWAFDLVRVLAPRPIIFCTACMHEDRAVWLRWFANKAGVPCKIIMTNCKAECGTWSDILIDDNPPSDWPGGVVKVPAKWGGPLPDNMLGVIYENLASQYRSREVASTGSI